MRILLFLTITFSWMSICLAKKPIVYTYTAQCLRVMDGDTLDILVNRGHDNFERVRVRLLRVQAPEVRTKDLAEKKDGIFASHFVAEELSCPYRGDSNVKAEMETFPLVVVSPGKDKYGRWLADVLYTKEGKSHNLSDVLKEKCLAIFYEGRRTPWVRQSCHPNYLVEN